MQVQADESALIYTMPIFSLDPVPTSVATGPIKGVHGLMRSPGTTLCFGGAPGAHGWEARGGVVMVMAEGRCLC